MVDPAGATQKSDYACHAQGVPVGIIRGGREMSMRIEETDTTEEIVMKIAGGNPEALTVCSDILKRGGEIDPDNMFCGLGALLFLDMHEIYEHRIWMFYKDVCGEDLPTMLAVNRACQLGFVDKRTLNAAIDEYGRGIVVQDLLRQVKERFPAFGVEMS